MRSIKKVKKFQSFYCLNMSVKLIDGSTLLFNKKDPPGYHENDPVDDYCLFWLQKQLAGKDIKRVHLFEFFTREQKFFESFLQIFSNVSKIVLSTRLAPKEHSMFCAFLKTSKVNSLGLFKLRIGSVVECLSSIIERDFPLEKLSIGETLFEINDFIHFCNLIENYNYLNTLQIFKCDFEVETEHRMLKLLSNSLTKNSSIKRLFLKRKCFGTKFFLNVDRYNLTFLNIMNVDSFKNLQTVVERQKELKYLSFRSPSLVMEESYIEFFRALKYNRTIKVLRIEDSGMNIFDCICDCVLHNKTLKTLSFSFAVFLNIENLKEACLRNGYLTRVELFNHNGPIYRYCLEEHCLLNSLRHDNTRRSVIVLLACQRHSKGTKIFSKDIACLVAKHLFETRADISCWID